MSVYKEHETWSSRLTFLLAAVGAAIGLGNIWKFPYIMGENGGGAFVLVYLLCIAFVAIPILIAEMLLGRRGRQSPPNAVARVAQREGRSQRWSLAGWLGITSAFLILTYYSVIAGWATAYIFKAGAGAFEGQSGAAIGDLFAALQANPLAMTFWHGLFMAIALIILLRGLRKGIEQTVRVLMPLLLVLLTLLAVYALLEGDVAAGIRFMFDFDFSAITPEVVLMAVGHAFFSVGVAMGLMLGFGAYLGRDVSIARSAVVIAVLDTAVALLAGIAIFPLVFAHGLDPAEGPGLIFVTLPIAFGNMTGGLIFGVLFFVLLFFAALTSVIGMMEPIIAWAEEHKGMNRKLATVLICSAAFVLGLGSVLSFNVLADWHPLAFVERFNQLNWYELVDYATANIMMPLGGLLLAVFVGWRMSRASVLDELDARSQWVFRCWHWLLRWVVPASIVLMFAANL